jgi:hypothetical protein
VCLRLTVGPGELGVACGGADTDGTLTKGNEDHEEEGRTFLPPEPVCDVTPVTSVTNPNAECRNPKEIRIAKPEIGEFDGQGFPSEV